MFRRVLIANRGEVAARVARTCRRLGIETVAVVSTVDRDLSWLEGVDKVVCIGGPRSYLDANAILDVAHAEGASAIHPGWGFLAENATFAARAEAIGITFVGPRPSLLRSMGDKVTARRTMHSLGVDVIPGSEGVLASPAQAQALAEQMGFPVLLKAVSGGGGRGMRRVYSADEVGPAFEEARAEALSAFGDGSMYLEKLIERGRHVEFQVLGDRSGRVVVLGDRECSLQRRHQKLLEESPSPVVDDATRSSIGAKLASALSALKYESAGTVEMLRDPAGNLYFMEMNTRLQVEHTVTELCCGLDLVEWQLRIAANQLLPENLARPQGHAVEVRINAEDPTAGFAPSPGTLKTLELPTGPGVRVDTHLSAGDVITPQYDSLLCKVLAHGQDRAEALDRLDAALGAFVVEGVHTTLELHRRILADPGFREGEYDTGTVESRIVSEVQ